MTIFQTEPTKIVAYPTRVGVNDEVFKNYALDEPVSIKGVFDVSPSGDTFEVEVIYAMISSYATLENSGPLTEVEYNAEVSMNGEDSVLLSYHIMQSIFVTITNPRKEPVVLYDPGTELEVQGWNNKDPQEVLDVLTTVADEMMDSTNLWNLTKNAIGERRKVLDNAIFIPSEEIA